jgi:predicted  nucleic acid-binding Zn-ribbon protein
MESTYLRRRLFGFAQQDVLRILADREQLFAHADERAQAAEKELEQIRAELAPLKSELTRKNASITALEEHSEQLQSQLSDLQAQLDEARRDPFAQADPSSSATMRFLIGEIAPILKAAEETAVRLFSDAQATTEHQLAEAERIRAELQVQIARANSWHERVEPMIRSAQSRLAETRQRIQEVPARIAEALAPVGEAMAWTSEQLVEFLGVAPPPPLAHAEPGPPAEEQETSAQAQTPEERDSMSAGNGQAEETKESPPPENGLVYSGDEDSQRISVGLDDLWPSYGAGGF